MSFQQFCKIPKLGMLDLDRFELVLEIFGITNYVTIFGISGNLH